MKTLVSIFAFILFCFPALSNINCDSLALDVRVDPIAPNGVIISIQVWDTSAHPDTVVETPCRQHDSIPAFFKYFIEYGDGTSRYTTASVDTHYYKTYSDHHIRVKLNYIYGDGDEPEAVTDTIPDMVTSGLLKNDIQFHASKDTAPDIQLSFDDAPVIDKVLTGHIRYSRNESIIETGYLSGYIKFYHNDKTVSPSGFTLLESREYRSDTLLGVAPPLDTASQYESVTIWAFKDLANQEYRDIYFDLKCNSSLEFEPPRDIPFRVEMEIDGGATYADTVIRPLLMAKDPNLMIVNKSEIELKDQYVEYEVRFQNIGNDYVDSVTIDLFLDPGLDLSTLDSLDTYYPVGRDSLIHSNFCRVVLDDINLPGIEQTVGGRKFLYEETIGYIKFKVFHEVDSSKTEYFLNSRADIRFGGLKTYATNEVTTKVFEKESVTLPVGKIYYGIFSIRSGINFPFTYKNYEGNGVNLGKFRNLLFGFVYTRPPKKSKPFYSRWEATYSSLGYLTPSQLDLDLYYLEFTGQARKNFQNHLSAGLGAGLSFLLKGDNPADTGSYSNFKLGIFADGQYRIIDDLYLGLRLAADYSPKLFDLEAAFFPRAEIYLQYDLYKWPQ